MKIVLTGFMATGKTLTGRELAKRLGYPFIDTDDLIIEREGMTIANLFKEKGEQYFRDTEKNVIKEISGKRKVVIAPGGGAIKDKRNMESLKDRGIMICLKAESEVILRRVQREKGVRPLLDVEDPLREIKRLLQERDPYYRQADYMIDTSHLTPQQVVQKIIKNLAMDLPPVYVDLGERSYEILIGNNIFHSLGIRIKEFRPSKIVIISNTTVMSLYGKHIKDSMNHDGLDSQTILIPDGEDFKDLYWASYLYGDLLKKGLDRRSLLIAFGGGVIGDITGFVASTYMRGIQYIQVPTTLLAQVDSSVGGKTAVNHPFGKNMIGTFWQPSLVFIDTQTLKSLPEREFLAGFAEVIKYGIIADHDLFDMLASKGKKIFSDKNAMIAVIKRCCEIKSEIVSRDEREGGLRAILNFGHTVGHALESATGYRRYLHGEAIAVGMCAASRLAVLMKLFSEEQGRQIRHIIHSYNLPTTIPQDISIDTLMSMMKVDKKFFSGRLRFVLPESIGKAVIVDWVEPSILKDVLASLIQS